MKKIAFTIILIAFTGLLIELLALAAHFVKFGDYNRAQIGIDKSVAKSAPNKQGVYEPPELAETADIRQKSVLHPYLGYITEGHKRRKGCESNRVQECFDRILVYTDKPLPRQSDTTLNVAILGGSFADGIARLGQSALSSELSKYPEYANREIRIFNLAAGGYKQPQQIANLNYYFAMGAEFDLVINIDGFNEMATPYNAYRDRGLHPMFPSNWDYRVAQSVTPSYLNAYAKKRTLQLKHAAIARATESPPLRYSPTLNFVWRVADILYKNQIAEADAELLSSKNTHYSQANAYEAKGPYYRFEDWDGFYQFNADVWYRGSLALDALSKAMGARYFHFLQPNQYIEDSKPLSPWEQKHAVLKSDSFGNVYQLTYPLIAPRAQQLLEHDISYRDLTYVFHGIERTLYIDNCCHINPDGIALISRHIGDLVIKQLRIDQT